MPTGYSVWLVTEIVGPDGNPYYDAFKEQPQKLWPAPNRVTMLTGTTWQSKVPFGDETTVASGLRFQLTLIVADATVDNQFEGYNHSPHPSGYTGIELKSITGLYQRLNHVDVVRV